MMTTRAIFERCRRLESVTLTRDEIDRSVGGVRLARLSMIGRRGLGLTNRMALCKVGTVGTEGRQAQGQFADYQEKNSVWPAWKASLTLPLRPLLLVPTSHQLY